MTRQRLMTPCCASPLLPQPYPCLHDWERYRLALPPRCWVGQRPRTAQMSLGWVAAEVAA